MDARRTLALLGLCSALATAGCRNAGRGHGRLVVHDPALGTLDGRALPEAEMAEDLAYARALALDGGEPTPPAQATRRPGRRVFLTAFTPGAAPIVTSALGPTLAASLRDAALALRTRVASGETGPAVDGARTRLVLDVTRARSSLGGAPTLAEVEPGGLAIACPDARLGYVLPGELATRGLLVDQDDGEPGLRAARVDALLDARLGGPRDGCRRLRVTTSAAVTAPDVEAPGRGAIALSRGRPPRPAVASVDDALLRARIGLGADYLARVTGDDGRFVYLYDARRDASIDGEYNVVRHAGATDALFEAYATLGGEARRAAGERALGWLDHALRTKGAQPNEVAWLPHDDNALGPIGGTGLALVAFAAHARATGSRAHLDRMRAMGRFLVTQLSPEGRFSPWFVDGGPREAWPVLYYHGEAMLGLLRLYAIDPTPELREAIERAARFRLSTPYEKPRDEGRDYWLVLALAELSTLPGRAPDAAFAARALAIAGAAGQEWDDDERAFLAAGEPWSLAPRASPTATLTEALATASSLARRLALDDGGALARARIGGTYVLAAQLDPIAVYAARDPARALGGVRGDPWTDVIRIDDVQHAMMSWLALRHAAR